MSTLEQQHVKEAVASFVEVIDTVLQSYNYYVHVQWNIDLAESMKITS